MSFFFFGALTTRTTQYRVRTEIFSTMAAVTLCDKLQFERIKMHKSNMKVYEYLSYFSVRIVHLNSLFENLIRTLL